MAAVPAALRKADIGRFAQRASQLEKAKPVVAYWCRYWILQQILSRGLQSEDEESAEYSSNLMDKLEQTKAELADNDAISDDIAALAYIEQFGNEIFQRADNAMRANRASRQTVDTFSASATFLELCQIWGSLDPETASKIKFAKLHAVRIAKAIKAGEDPNLSNPVPDHATSQEDPLLSPADPEVRTLDRPPHLEQHQGQSRQPSVEEIPDESEPAQRHFAQQSTLDQSFHPSRTPSNQPQPKTDNGPAPAMPSPQDLGENYYQNPPVGDVSPIVSPVAQQTESVGGYFPAIPDGSTEDPASSTSQVPRSETRAGSFLPESSGVPGRIARSTVHEPSPPAPLDSAAADPSLTPTDHHTNHYSATQARSLGAPIRPPPPQALPVPANAPVHPMIPHPTGDEVDYTANEEAILKAQKHARWAISALNFEDVKTAVKELRSALETLGAT